MTTTTKHTPTPWKYSRDTFGVGRIFGREPDGEYSLATPDFDQMTMEQCDANAEHIVRCVNAHDDLVAALDVIANAATVGGISAGERKGLARAAAIAAAALAKVQP